MKKIWGREVENFLLSACFKDTLSGISRANVKWALFLLAGLLAVSVQGQTSFYSPQMLVGASGSETNDNAGNIPDSGCPNIAGFAPNAPVWYTWTATKDGVVEMDTIGRRAGDH